MEGDSRRPHPLLTFVAIFFILFINEYLWHAFLTSIMQVEPFTRLNNINIFHLGPQPHANCSDMRTLAMKSNMYIWNSNIFVQRK